MRTEKVTDADGDEGTGKKHHGSRLSDERIPLQLDDFPQRPRPLLELGEPFLGTGTLDKGFKLPTGAVWQPSLLLFGTYRTSIQSFDGDDRITEWSNRLDLFFNLSLSGTERLVLALRPLDRYGRFSTFYFDHPDPGLDGEFVDELNLEITGLFFEGDFGEIFPNLSKNDFKRTDVGFSVGRQPLLFQEGLLINDTIDGIGITRNTLQPNTSNYRMTFFWGFNEVGRGGPTNNTQEYNDNLLGFLTSTDFRKTTMDIDLVYVVAKDELVGDLVAGGLSAVQRFGQWNTSFRILGSFATERETEFATDGALLFAEISTTPHRTHNLAYFTLFAAADEFSSAARGPATGGPLGRAGINFAAVGIGNYGAPLSNRARDVAGGAFGYQWFFDHTRKQVIAEIGGRVGTASDIDDATALTIRYQAAFGKHFVAIVDGYGSYTDDPLRPNRDQEFFGGRVELLTKF